MLHRSTSRRAVGARAIARGVAIGLVLACMRVARDAHANGRAFVATVDDALASSTSAKAASTLGAGRFARVELDGQVVRDASSVGATPSDDACARACEDTKGCNVWVRGRDDASVDVRGACWLKRRDRASIDVAHRSEGVGCAWNSGTLAKDFARESEEVVSRLGASALAESRTATLTIEGFGDVVLRLKPEWHHESVQFIRALALERGSCEGTCEIYRVEPGFLVQGTLKSTVVASNTHTKDGPKLMERGDVGWAGEGPGPDFFFYLGERPAAHFGKKHTVFAVVEDDASMRVLERVVRAPSSTPDGPNTMRFINTRPKLTLRLDTASQ